MGRIAAGLRRGFIVAACGGLGACDLLNPSELVISNVGTTEVSNLAVVSTEGQSWPLGDLPPGKTVHFRKALGGEGSLFVEYTVGGKRVTATGGTYYTSGYLNPADATVTIKGEQAYIDSRSG